MPQGPYIRRRGRSATFNFQLFEIDGVDFRVDAAHASADTKIMKDEGAEANTANAFVDEGQGYSIILSDAEMSAARIVVYVVDQSTKVWLDTALVIETFEPPGLLQASDIATLASQTSFTLAEGSADNDAYNGTMAIITDASTLAQKAVGLISDYVGSTKTVTLGVDPGIFTMAAGDYIDIIAVPLVWDEVLTGSTHNVPNSAGRRLRQIQEAGGYTGSAIYIDTINGTDGTTDFENGVDSKPVKSIADANTLATSLGISRFMIAPGSSITFAASQENQEFIGDLWTLALGAQSVSGSHIFGAKVSGTGTSTTEAHYEHCEMGACTIGKAHVEDCDLEGTLTLSAADTYIITNCHHSGTPIIDFGAAVANTTVHMHGYNGAVTVKNMGQSGTDTFHFDSSGGKLTLDNTNTGGTVNLNGTLELSNSGTGQTINKAGMVIDLLPTALVGGRMDSDVEAIDNDVDAAAQMRDNLDTTQRFIVAAIFTPTTTQCQPDAVFFGDTAGTLEATDDHYNGRIILFITGALQGQATDITDYDGNNKRFTYTATTEAVADNDQFVIL